MEGTSTPAVCDVCGEGVLKNGRCSDSECAERLATATSPGGVDRSMTENPADVESVMNDLIDERVGLWSQLDDAMSHAEELTARIATESLGSGVTVELDLSEHPDPFFRLQALEIVTSEAISSLHDVDKAIKGHQDAIAEFKRKQMQKVLFAAGGIVLLIVVIINATGG